VEEVPVVESEAIVDVKGGLTRGWSGPLKVAAAQPQAVSRTEARNVERSHGAVVHLHDQSAG
jgi:hypothetical protein